MFLFAHAFIMLWFHAVDSISKGDWLDFNSAGNNGFIGYSFVLVGGLMLLFKELEFHTYFMRIK